MRGRVSWAVLFWIWGFVGLFLVGGDTIAGEGPTVVGVLIWIGGMMLLGLSALTSPLPDSSDN